MCKSIDQPLPYTYMCALCGQLKTEGKEQGMSICSDCSLNVEVSWDEKASTTKGKEQQGLVV